jgi:hypothetical protein
MTRRQLLGRAIGAGGAAFLGLLDPAILFAKPRKGPRKAESVILLWMGGGMSHIDTFDPQPGSDIGGPIQAIATTAEGIRISQYLPRLAREFKHLSLIRSVTGSEFDHDRATYVLHTGYPPLSSMKHSTLGSVVAKYMGPPHDECLPPYVSIGIDWAAGYLGPKYAPYYVGAAQQANANLVVPQGLGQERFNDRLKLLKEFDKSFNRLHVGDAAMAAYAQSYSAALLMMRPQTAKVFNLDDEPQAVREAYGAKSGFGQGCLLARRLVQAGVRFVEVALGGWDTHQENFPRVEQLSGELDVAASTLIQDLHGKGLLERTILLVASEFGRTPTINGNGGRDHWPRVWSAVIGGGGLQGGRLIGRSDRGQEVADRPIRVGELHATICEALGIDFTQTNHSPEKRPFRIVKDESAAPIKELFA